MSNPCSIKSRQLFRVDLNRRSKDSTQFASGIFNNTVCVDWIWLVINSLKKVAWLSGLIKRHTADKYFVLSTRVFVREAVVKHFDCFTKEAIFFKSRHVLDNPRKMFRTIIHQRTTLIKHVIFESVAVRLHFFWSVNRASREFLFDTYVC